MFEVAEILKRGWWNTRVRIVIRIFPRGKPGGRVCARPRDALKAAASSATALEICGRAASAARLDR